MFDTPVNMAEILRTKSKSSSLHGPSSKHSVHSVANNEKLLSLTVKSEIVSHEMHKFAKIMKLDNISPSDVI